MSKLYHLILPALSGSLLATVGTIQYLRNEIIDTKIKDFVKTARAKGVPESKVYTRHILRNSLLPIATFFGYEITGLIGGIRHFGIDIRLSGDRAAVFAIHYAA